MSATDRGLYEVLITEALEARLRGLGNRLVARRDGLRAADAADRVALHLSRIVQRALAAEVDEDRVRVSIALARELIRLIDASTKGAVATDSPLDPGQVLRAVVARLPDGTPEEISEPLIPLLDTVLLTNAPGEPTVGSQVRTEVHSADRIDVVIAFIRRTGLRPLIGALRSHCESGKSLRVLTTTYTNSTEGAALDELRGIGAEVRVSYDIRISRP